MCNCPCHTSDIKHDYDQTLGLEASRCCEEGVLQLPFGMMLMKYMGTIQPGNSQYAWEETINKKDIDGYIRQEQA